MRQWEDLAAWQRAVFERAADSLALGKRQREVARHYFAGASLKEIAVRVRMPEGTLRTHLRRLHRRTGRSDRTGIVHVLYRLGRVGGAGYSTKR